MATLNAKINELADEGKALENRVNKLKQNLAKRINSLPDNKKITRMKSAPNCFIISSSEVFKHDNWLPEFHDFKEQYKIINEAMKNVELADYIPALQEMLKRKSMLVKKRGCQPWTLRIHPTVIKHIKSLIVD